MADRWDEVAPEAGVAADDSLDGVSSRARQAITVDPRRVLKVTHLLASRAVMRLAKARHGCTWTQVNPHCDHPEHERDMDCARTLASAALGLEPSWAGVSGQDEQEWIHGFKQIGADQLPLDLLPDEDAA